MKKLFIIGLCLSPFLMGAQNVGIGTTTPTEKLEVKKTLRSTIKISAGSIADTTQLILSNSGSTAGFYTDFSIKSIREEGLFFSSQSDLGPYNSANSLVILPTGNVGTGILPTAKLHVNGGVKLEGLNLFEFGAGVAGKEVNAGKIGYNAFGQNALTFVGAGTNSTNRAFYFFGEGGTTFSGPATITGNINIGGQLQVNGSPGTDGQVLTSNGTSDPQWLNAAFGNNTRFGVNLSDNTIGGATLAVTSTEYNLNTTDIVIGASSITINKSGLYHFNGNYSGWVSSTISVPTPPEFSISMSFTGGLAYIHTLETWKVLPTRTSTLTYFLRQQFSQDFYITAPTTLSIFSLFLYSGAPAFTSTSMNLFGYLVNE